MRISTVSALLGAASAVFGIANAVCEKPSPKHPICEGPIPGHSLPDVLSAQRSNSFEASEIEAIRQTLALYPFAIDGKNFDALSKMFAEDAVANYSEPLNVLTPLSVIQETLEASLMPVTTHHSFGTQYIAIISPKIAQSITYYTAAHFGSGELATEVAYAYGQYQDTWHKQWDGTWKIVYRNLVYMVRFAAIRLMNQKLTIY